MDARPSDTAAVGTVAFSLIGLILDLVKDSIEVRRPEAGSYAPVQRASGEK